MVPRLSRKASFRTQARQEPLPWPFCAHPLAPLFQASWCRCKLRAASFLAVQWFLPLASAQSDDSGQFQEQGRAPSSRQIRYHRDQSQL